MDIRITSFNIEWMVSLFGGRWADWDGTIPDTFSGRRLGDITLEAVPDLPELIGRITGVIDAIDPDILCVQEGPPRRDQMEAFVDRHLGGRFDVVTANSQWQANHVLIRKGLGLDVSADDPKDRATIERWSGGPWYPWGLVAAEERKLQRFHRQPVRLMLTPDAADPDAPRLELISLQPSSCPADIFPLGGDGVVNVFDLLDLLARWNEPVPSPADFDCDGIVNVFDLLFLLNEWGPCN